MSSLSQHYSNLLGILVEFGNTRKYRDLLTHQLTIDIYEILIEHEKQSSTYIISEVLEKSSSTNSYEESSSTNSYEEFSLKSLSQPASPPPSPVLSPVTFSTPIEMNNRCSSLQSKTKYDKCIIS